MEDLFYPGFFEKEFPFDNVFLAIVHGCPMRTVEIW
jgi:hypothetical protein